MSDSTTIAIRTHPLFRDIDPMQWDRLAGFMKARSFPAGATVVEQGTPGEEMFIIMEGEFRVLLKNDALGMERELKVLKAGDFFGEMALFTGRVRTASVQAKTTGRALVLHAGDLRRVLVESPEIALALCRGLANRLEEADRKEAAVPFVSLDAYPGAREAWPLLPAKTSRFQRAIALQRTADRVVVGMVDPYDVKARSFVRDVLRQYSIDLVAIGEADFERFCKTYLKADVEGTVEEIAEILYVNPAGQPQPLGEQQTAEVLKDAFRKAIQFGASDLHFEPGDGTARVRMRVDGNMAPVRDDLAVSLFDRVTSRLKVMGEMDITVKRLPQDGRFAMKAGERRIEVRVSTTPCQGGEKTVLRVLDKSRQKLSLDDLILSRPAFETVADMFRSPSGLILVTGPTGSGKTTTLYAGLSEIWQGTQTVNIVTIEDPVEYELGYGTQIQVNRPAGLDFPQILRTVMRQDPDVILVGEIRDPDSASIALEAATTGHLVLSSLHTDFALESLIRLRKLQVKSYLAAAALKCVISQRLVARICLNCREEIDDPQAVAGLTALGVLEPGWSGKLVRGRGCSLCRDRGSFGRVAVCELLLINDKLRGLIDREAPWDELQAQASGDCFVPMRRYARFLLAEGLVTPEAVAELFPKPSLVRPVS